MPTLAPFPGPHPPWPASRRYAVDYELGPPTIDNFDPPANGSPRILAITPARKTGDVEVEVEVEVRVLGPIEVVGASRGFERAWAVELIAYLAMHPRGVSNQAWSLALWPDRVLAPATLHSIASAARRGLGRSLFGDDHLPHRHGRLQLAPTVSTDWRRLVEATKSPNPATWKSALTMVRGRPFDSLRSPDWTVLEGVAADVEEGVVALAERLAEHLLALGDGAGAASAARRGLRASPYDERLYRLLMRAADARGHPAGVESVMAELLWVLNGPTRARSPKPGSEIGFWDLGWREEDLFDSIHPTTAALYRSLTRRRGVSGEVVARR